LIKVFRLEKIYTLSLIFAICVAKISGIGTQFVNVPASVDEIKYGTQNAIIQFPVNQLGKTSVSLSHNDWYGGFSVFSMKISNPILSGQGILRLKYGGFENLELRNESPSDNPLGIYSAFGLDITSGFQIQYHDYQIAALLRMMKLRIYTHSSSGMTGCISILKKMSRDWGVGFSVSQFGYMSPFIENKSNLPVSANILLIHKTDFKQFRNFFSFTGGAIPATDNYIISATNSIKWKNVDLSLASHISKNVTEVSGGVSFLLGIYQIGYGFRIADHKLGIPQVLELTVILP